MESMTTSVETAYALRGGNRARIMRSLAELKAGRAERHASAEENGASPSRLGYVQQVVENWLPIK